MARIRVLQVVSGIAIGEQAGGAEQIALQIALNLNRTAFKPAVFVMQRYGTLTEATWQNRLLEAETPIFGVDGPHRGPQADLLQIWRELWATVTAFCPDVVNSHSERGDTLNMLVHLLHPNHPVPVRTMHTDLQWQTRPWIGRILSQGIFPAAFAGEIAVSQAVRQALDQRPLARLLRKKATLCYAAVDTAFFRRRFAESHAGIALTSDGPNGSLLQTATVLPPGIPLEHPRIGIVGRLAHQKGHTFLLQAIAQLANKRPAHLLIIGSGVLEEDLRNQAATLGITERVHFLGSRRDVADILQHLDLLVSSSLWEGLPGVILEAMAAKVPVIATDVSGSREVVLHGETGLLVPAGQVDALADAITQALDQPDRMEQMAERASRYVEQFTVQRMVKSYAEIYQMLTRKLRS